MFTFRFGINVGISLYSAALLAFIYIAVRRQAAEYAAHPRRQRLFLSIIVLNFLLIVSDMLSRFDGQSGTLFTLCKIGNFVLFLFNPLLVPSWYFYLCDQIGLDRASEKRGAIFQFSLYAINTAAVIATPFTGWLYYFDAANVYHRGPLFWITGLITVLMILLCELLITRCRERLERRFFYALFLFPTIPVVTNIIQFAFYGIAFALNATAYSLIIVFVLVQSRSMLLEAQKHGHDFTLEIASPPLPEIMVDSASVLIAAYSGQPGGTMNTLLYAMRQGREVVQIAIPE